LLAQDYGLFLKNKLATDIRLKLVVRSIQTNFYFLKIIMIVNDIEYRYDVRQI
jgi:hypothetical protein